MHKLITTVISLLILFMWSTKQMLHDVFSSLCTKFQLRGAWVASAPVCLSLLPFVESALVKVGELGEEPTRNDKLNPFLTGARVGRTRMLALWWEFQFRATVHQINFKTCISMFLVHSHKNKDYVIDFWKKNLYKRWWIEMLGNFFLQILQNTGLFTFNIWTSLILSNEW